jgi:hypothetical protein
MARTSRAMTTETNADYKIKAGTREIPVVVLDPVT